MPDRDLIRARAAAVAGYAAALGLCIAIAWSAVSDMLGRQAEVAASAEVLSRLQGHRPAAPGAPETADAPTGSPYLEGPTMTTAGATLLQRVAGAVTRVGGNVVSTQVELQGTQAKTGFISVTTSCDLDQGALQKLLYDLEAGMPFLFVDQLVVQAPASETANADGRLRVLLAVSGQWQGAKL